MKKNNYENFNNLVEELAKVCNNEKLKAFEIGEMSQKADLKNLKEFYKEKVVGENKERAKKIADETALDFFLQYALIAETIGSNQAVELYNQLSSTIRESYVAGLRNIDVKEVAELVENLKQVNSTRVKELGDEKTAEVNFLHLHNTVGVGVEKAGCLEGVELNTTGEIAEDTTYEV